MIAGYDSEVEDNEAGSPTVEKEVFHVDRETPAGNDSNRDGNQQIDANDPRRDLPRSQVTPS